MSFIYQAPGAPEKRFALIKCKESGCYISGIDAQTNTFKTFRKDRILSYLENAEFLLDTPFTKPPPPVKKGVEHGPEIVFTGFPSVQRAHLEAKAVSVGMMVCKSVTKNLSYLCAGPNAGPTKVAKARDQHVFIVSEPQFFTLIETGELPDEIEPL